MAIVLPGISSAIAGIGWFNGRIYVATLSQQIFCARPSCLLLQGTLKLSGVEFFALRTCPKFALNNRKFWVSLQEFGCEIRGMVCGLTAGMQRSGINLFIAGRRAESVSR